MADATRPGRPVPEVPGFEDLEEIGRGGFAVVYRASQPQFARSVAIKILTSPGLDDAALQRFARECTAMGQLSWHPNVLHVYDQGTTSMGYPYLVAEHIEAGSLATRLASTGSIPVEEVRRYGIELASALQAAHDADLLHRDVKPGNVLIDRLGHVKLADFGIAAVTGSSLTASGMVTASLAHAAPEVLGGQRASARSDIYSLGSTLFTLLTGRAPFATTDDEDSVAMIVRAATTEAPDLRLLGVPDDVAAVIRTAMAKDPANRYASASAMGSALGGNAPPAADRKPDELDDRQTSLVSDDELPTQVSAKRSRPVRPARPADDQVTEAPSDIAADDDPTRLVFVKDIPEPAPPTDHGRRRLLAGGIGVAGLLLTVGVIVVISAGDDDGTVAGGTDPTVSVAREHSSTTGNETEPSTAHSSPLLGSWYSVDPSDGSSQVLTVTELGEGNAVQVMWRDSRSYLCDEAFGDDVAFYGIDRRAMLSPSGGWVNISLDSSCEISGGDRTLPDSPFSDQILFDPSENIVRTEDTCWSSNPPGPDSC